MVFSAKEGVFLLVWCYSMFQIVKGVERGKIDIQQVENDGFHCEYVSFNTSFSSGTVRVFASINHGSESIGVHDTAFVWVEDVTTSRFKACLVRGGQVAGVNTTIDWFAIQGSNFQPDVYDGKASFSLFTTGTQCKQVAFPQAFSAVPKVHVTVQHATLDQRKDAMSIWMENVSRSHFEVCLRESRALDGAHNNLVVNWLAYKNYPSSWKVKASSEIVFSGNDVPSAENNYALCKYFNFTEPFYKPPVVLTNVINGGSNNANIACPLKGPLSSWLEEVTNNHFRVCIKDSAGYNGQRSDVIVDYLVIGDLDPCRNITCFYQSHCEASSPWKFSCVCEDSCPPYEEQVCASDGRTFKNLCLLNQEICETRGNYTDYHPGSCTGFPLQKGRHKFQNTPSWAEDQCEIIKFEPFIFYPHTKIYIQLTVNHANYSDVSFVHEATTPWVESVNVTQFTVCVTRAGRNDYPADSFATVDWFAYQGAPPGGITGEEMFARWWTGTSCQTVTLPKGKYSNSPTIFATAEHYRSRQKHDATSVWLEDVSASSFKICLRELQNFAGVHDDISVNWLAFDSIHRPLFKEHRDVSFPNNVLPLERNNYAFCQDVIFSSSKYKSPTVVLTAKHSSGGGNTAAECNGIVSWIESITDSRFRICAKELFVKRFDPLTVSYAVLADICQDDWAYFRGYCYRKVASCDSWSSSQGACAIQGANLPSIHSQEENVYVQSLHGGERSWLGLSDINTEGTFVWSDGSPLDFHNWAKKQPNNYRNEDCAHTLGFIKDHKYEWNDINCTDCHRFTCKKDYNECDDFSYECPESSTCVNNDGSYTCRCNDGFILNYNGNCTDIDECRLGRFSCHAQSECVNVPGSYRCRCFPGYGGNGKRSCDAPFVNATSSCVNLLGSQTKTDGVIESNKITASYTKNMDCQWNISSNAVLELVFHRFSTESSDDYVILYDGVSLSSPVIGRFSGSSLPAPITTSSNNLYVRFKTDQEADDSKTYKGFSARYRAIVGGSIRLNKTSSAGRVEIYYDGQWGTVCDDAWDINDANVVCRQLGFKRALQFYKGATHGQGTGPIWIDDVACSGSESHLYECRHRGWGNNDCTHIQDASVLCTHGSSVVRLMGGGVNYGRVEVFYNAQWGTVCDDGWDMNDAEVVCKELGFSGASYAPVSAAFGQGSTYYIWMDNVQCQGTEASLLSCSHRGWRAHGWKGKYGCYHNEDASVVCKT